jgi:signal transduction histidine kinase
LTIRTAAQPGGSISIQVEDSGIGIDPEHAARIFDAYFTTKSNGSGLGLAICRAIIDAHGGDLEVYPGDPLGCTFHIVLPIAPPPRIPQARL